MLIYLLVLEFGLWFGVTPSLPHLSTGPLPFIDLTDLIAVIMLFDINILPSGCLIAR